jgi:hypothetical protein
VRIDGLVIAASIVVLGLVALFGLTVIVWIWKGKISLERLLSEPNGDASISRFQLLVFVFVVATSFFLVVASANQPALPNVPHGVLLLLGISGGSYLVSKGIQFSNDAGVQRPPALVVTPQTAAVQAGGQPVTFQADVRGVADPTVTWAISHCGAGGSIDSQSGVYTPPKASSAQGMDHITATSKAMPSLSDTVMVTVNPEPPAPQQPAPQQADPQQASTES